MNSTRRRWGGLRGGLHRLLGQDRVVSVMDWNSMQFAQLLYAVPISGNIVHPVDVRQPTGQVLSSMREAGGSSCLLYSPPFKGLAEAAVSAGLVKDEFCMSIDEATGQDLSHGNGGETGLPELDETRVASVLFSSGTTGKPKGVRYRHRDIVLTVWAMETGLSAFPGPPSRLTSSDTVFSLIPFFHLWSWGTLYISTLIGSNYVLGGRFDPRTTSELIKRSGATWMSMVPPTMFSALTSYDRDSLDGMKVLIGGSAIPSSILRFASEHSIELAGIYGFTDGLAAGIGTSEIMDDLPSRNADAVNAVTPLVFTDFQIGGDGSELGFQGTLVTGRLLQCA
ncbi:AMP-binding protein [Thermogymnomonas acidicola]|uniref:AMP-binding protein n=1 Tax=Thermogymnomonas acidicola TaxID=399579 RepID=UPI001396AAFA|nr:AMP-binding protein [Thermogymnomonas acidicola]